MLKNDGIIYMDAIEPIKLLLIYHNLVNAIIEQYYCIY